VHCVVCGKACSGTDYVAFQPCGHRAHRRCVQAWLDLPWESKVVCPLLCCREKEAARLDVKRLDQNWYLVVDLQCDHCIWLMQAIGNKYLNKINIGMDVVTIDEDERFKFLANENHFPHSYVEKPATKALVSKDNGVANMFWSIAQQR